MDGETSKENSCRDIVDSRISDKIYYLALSQRNLAFKWLKSNEKQTAMIWQLGTNLLVFNQTVVWNYQLSTDKEKKVMACFCNF